MRYLISIDRDEALKNGKDYHGEHVVSVPSCSLTEAQREHVAKHASKASDPKAQYDYDLRGINAHGTRYYVASPVEATAEAVSALIDRGIAKLAQVEADKAREAEALAGRARQVLEARKVTYTQIYAGSQLYKQYRPDWPYIPSSESPAYAVTQSREAMAWLKDLEAQNTTEKAEAEAEDRRVAEQKAETERKELAEMVAWAEQHGSPRLRRSIEEGIECLAIYLDERLAVDRPGWQWYDSVSGTTKDPRNPTESAFALLDEARTTDPEACLQYYVDGSTRGYVAESTYLGKTIVFGVERLDDDSDECDAA